MTDQSYWGWAAKGMGGCVNLLAMLAQEGSLPSQEHLQMLREQAERFVRLTTHLTEEVRKAGNR